MLEKSCRWWGGDVDRVVVVGNVGALQQAEPSNVGGTAPPSVLPDISPTRGEIGRHHCLANHHRCRSERHAETVNLPLWGRCPAGQRGARRIAVSPSHPRTRIPSPASTRQIHAPNSYRFDNPFREFEGKYSNLIDIAAGGHDEQSPYRDDRASALEVVRFVSLWAQRPSKMAIAA